MKDARELHAEVHDNGIDCSDTVEHRLLFNTLANPRVATDEVAALSSDRESWVIEKVEP